MLLQMCLLFPLVGHSALRDDAAKKFRILGVVDGRQLVFRHSGCYGGIREVEHAINVALAVGQKPTMLSTFRPTKQAKQSENGRTYSTNH